MREEGGGTPLRLARLVVHAASLRLPRAGRREFRREWCAELEAEAREMGGLATVWVSLGAWADAGALRTTRYRTTGGDGMGGWAREIGLSIRALIRAPGFAVVSVVTLALGLGGSAAVFSLLDRVVLSPLPYPEAERLVRLQNQVPGVGPDERWSLSTAQWVHLTDHATTLDAVGLTRGLGGTVQTASGPERVQGVQVTESVMGLLGARVRHGRLLQPADDRPGAAPVALVSHGFWRRTLGGTPDAVGTTVTFEGGPVEVVGVLEPGLRVPGWPAGAQPDLWLPLRVDRGGSFGNNHVFPGLARLAPGATPEAAEAEMARLAARLPEAFPDAYSQGFFDRYGFRTEAVPLKESVLGALDRNLWILFGGVLLVLGVAAANVANLFLVRMEERAAELAVRRALGAGRGTLLRHLLAEGAALAGLGAALGLLGAWIAVPLLAGLAPGDLPRMEGVGLTPGALLLTTGLAALTAGALAAWPALTLDRPSAEALAGARSGGSRGARRLRSALVVAQVALALTLSVGGALLLQTLARLGDTEVGFEPRGVLAVDLHLAREAYPDDVALWDFYRRLVERVEALPGVTAAGLGEAVPIRSGYGCTVQGFADRTVYDRMEAAGMTTCAGQGRVTPGYFDALGIPVLAGRTLTAGDHDEPGRASVVVSRAFAERFWPGEDPLGKGVAPSGRSEPPFYTVVGVVGDVPARADGAPPLSRTAVAVYYPVRKDPETPERWGWWWPGSMTLLVRSDLEEPTDLLPALRTVVDELDPAVPLAEATTMARVVDDATAQLAFLSLLLVTTAATALLLAAVGLWGVVAYGVSRRTREIGMRLALGAEPAAVVGMVVTGALRLAGVGILAGLALAALGSRAMEGLLVGVGPTDPVAWAGACLALTAVATLAAWLPARRAARVDPVEALRGD